MDDPEPFNGFLRGTVGERGLVRPTVAGPPVETLLARHGVRPDDVEAIVLTHAHADHVWNVDRFPRARVLASRPALQRLEDVAARWPQLVPAPLYPEHALRFLRAERGRRVETVEDGPTPIDGIAICYLGGHAVDSAGVVIATGDGPVVHPGDTVWTYRNLEDDHPVGALESVERCLEAMAWTRAQGGRFLPSHDPAVHERHPDGVVAWG
jgi:glyoxylase-like metal-dependent hydrolase (beta-lactamase superfamily II)